MALGVVAEMAVAAAKLLTRQLNSFRPSASTGRPFQGAVYCWRYFSLMETMEKMKNFGKLLAQVMVTLLIFVVFTAYVWQAQIAYEATSVGWKKATLFSTVIFAGGFSYDIAKHLAFLEPQRFWKFFSHLRNAVFRFLLIIVLCSVSGYLFNQGSFEAKYWAFWIYLGALTQIYWVLDGFTKSIDAALEKENNKAMHATSA